MRIASAPTAGIAARATRCHCRQPAYIACLPALASLDSLASSRSESSWRRWQASSCGRCDSLKQGCRSQEVVPGDYGCVRSESMRCVLFVATAGVAAGALLEGPPVA